MSEVSNQEREAALAFLRKMHELARREYESKALQYERLGHELGSLLESMRNYKGTIAAMERDLGSTSQIRLPEAVEVKISKPKPVDVTQVVMKIVAEYQDSGHIQFNDIFRLMGERGYEISREYLHTVLNRKKNYQGKLDKDENDGWFLTDKGKEELGLN